MVICGPMKTLWSLIRGFLAFIGFIVFALAAIGAWSLSADAPSLPDKIVLAYTFNGTPADKPKGPSWLSHFVPAEPSLSELTEALYAAAQDEHVVAFAARLGAGDYDWAKVQELQEALSAFKARGKRTYVYAESYGDVMSGMGEYYLASVFDEIWIQPVGSVAITGFQAQVPYFKKLLENIGVTAEILQKGEYKTAPESALLEHMSDAQRSTLHAILSSMMTDFFESVSKGRKLPAERIGQLIDGAPYTALEARERKLVDEVGYIDQLIAKLELEDKKKQGLVNVMDYLAADPGKSFNKIIRKDKQLAEKETKNQSIALVYVTGMILPESGKGESLLGDHAAYALDIANAIGDAGDNPDIGAIVLRVDSPGGSATASETIRRAVEVAKARGKYVVVSMGSEAASGGYWVSVNGDRIYAQPGTLTGSIGVFGGKANFAGLWDKIGVTWDSVKFGANVSMWSPNEPYAEEDRATLDHMLDDIYDAFIDRVAKGRKFAPEVVESMARGRVWTGRQAKERGLIDAIGGLHVALEDAAQKLGRPLKDTDVLVMPNGHDKIDDILGFFASGAKILELFRPFQEMLVLARHPEWSWAKTSSFAIQPPFALQ